MSLPIWRPIWGRRRGPKTTSASTIRISESAIPRLSSSICGAISMKVHDTRPRSGVTIGGGLPGKTAGGRRPRAQQLAQQNHAAQMVGVVRAEVFKLLTHGHPALRFAGHGWAADGLLKPRSIFGGLRGFLDAL